MHAVLTAADIPGKNLIPMIHPDWPVLADGEVRHVGEAVALVAAESRAALQEALATIAVEYEPMPPLLDMEESLERGEVITHWKVRRGEAGRRAGAARRGGGRGDVPHARTRSTRTSRPTG